MDKQTLSIYLQLDTLFYQKFTIHRMLAHGSFGSVFLVTSRETSRRTALKLELLKPMSEPLLKKEGALLKKLQDV